MKNPNKQCDKNRRTSNNRNSKPNRSKDFRRNKEIRDTAEREMLSESNDPAWYTQYPSLADDAGKLGFGTAVAEEVELLDDGYAAPSLCTFYFEPTIGISNGPDSPINRSAQGMYSYLRSKLRLANNYDKSDMMIMIVALDSLHMFHAFLRRAYGVASLYSPTNRAFPEGLLDAMGISKSILNNLAEFRTYINQFAVRMGRYALPGKIDLVTRHQWMCTGLYSDKPNTRSQTYLFVPAGYWKYDNTVTTGSRLIFKSWSSTGTATLSDIQTFGDDLLAAIFGDEDAGDISGDLYNAYGAEAMLQMPETEDGYRIIPVYDEMVLSQINNLRISGTPTNASNEITQDPSINNGAILFTPSILSNIPPSFNHRLMVNSYKEKPTPDEVMEMTRFMTDYTLAYDSGTYTATLKNAGSELITSVVLTGKMKTMSASGTTRWATVNQRLVSNKVSMDMFTPLEQLQIYGLISAFDWHFPLFVGVNATATEDSMNYPLWDIDNFVSMSENMLQNLNYVALLSQFHAPNSYM